MDDVFEISPFGRAPYLGMGAAEGANHGRHFHGRADISRPEYIQVIIGPEQQIAVQPFYIRAFLLDMLNRALFEILHRRGRLQYLGREAG